mgnify:CR=1 FL=1
MQNIFKQLLAPTWQQREQAAKACSEYYSYENDLSTEAKQQLKEWLLELGEQKNLYLTAILSFWSHVTNLEAKYKAASSRHINAFYQARIDRAACESWRKLDLEEPFPLDEDDEKLKIDWLSNPSTPIYFVINLMDELEPLQQQLVDMLPNLASHVGDLVKQTLAKMPQITDTTYQACLEEFRDSCNTGNFQKFAQHINTPARIAQWFDYYSLENNRDAEILDHYLDIIEYAPQHSATQILTALIDFYQCYPSIERTPQLLHTFASLCQHTGAFPPFVIDFAMQALAREREESGSFWDESLVYFLTHYDVQAYADDIIYFLDHPYERHHYTAKAALSAAIKNIHNFPDTLIDKLIQYGLFEGGFDPNFSGSIQFFNLIQVLNKQRLKSFESTIKHALNHFMDDMEYSDIAIEEILPILIYLTEQGIDLKSDIKTIIEKLELEYAEDIGENEPAPNMDEILAQSKTEMTTLGLTNDEAELELQQSMLLMKQLFGVAEDQTLEEKFTQNSQDAAKEDSLNEIDILLRQLKLLAS